MSEGSHRDRVSVPFKAAETTSQLPTTMASDSPRPLKSDISRSSKGSIREDVVETSSRKSVKQEELAPWGSEPQLVKYRLYRRRFVGLIVMVG